MNDYYPPGFSGAPGPAEDVEHRCPFCEHTWKASMYPELGGWFYSKSDDNGNCPECGKWSDQSIRYAEDKLKFANSDHDMVSTLRLAVGTIIIGVDSNMRVTGIFDTPFGINVRLRKEDAKPSTDMDMVATYEPDSLWEVIR